MTQTTSDSVLFFEEVGGPKRNVTLLGVSSPHGGPRRGAAFDIGTELRQVRQYEPGMNSPVRHVTGVNSPNLVVHGDLRDYDGGDGYAAKLRDKILNIAQDGRKLRVVWFDKVYYGVLAKANLGVESARDYLYDLTFELDASENKRAVLSKFALPIQTLPDFSSLQDSLNVTFATFSIPGLSFDIANQLTSLFSAALSPLVDIVRIVGDIETEISDVAGAFRQLTGSLSSLLGALGYAMSYLDGNPISGDPEDGTSDLAALQAAWTRARADAIVALQDAMLTTFYAGVYAEKKSTSVTTGKTYTVRDGDTVDGIAGLIGTTPEIIRSLNPGLAFEPTAGTVLKVP